MYNYEQSNFEKHGHAVNLKTIKLIKPIPVVC